LFILIMNTEMNNNDRKKHAKTLAIAGMGFLLIAAAFTFSFANSGQQLVNAQENQTQGAGGGNATQTIVAVPFDTFTGSGVISATVSEAGGGNQTSGGGNQTSGGGNQTSGGGNQTSGGGNQTSGAASAGGGEAHEYILGGNWNMEVQAGNMTNFGANFIMVHPDGTEYHVHNITNFVTPTAGIQLVQGQEATISGSADIYTNGTNRWPGADTTLTLTQNGAVMTIMPAAEDTDNHFQGQPIYGIVSALTGENGTSIVQTTPPGQAQQQQEEGGDEGPLGGLLGGGDEQQQEGGNQTGGGPLGDIGEQIGELFGGGGGGQGQ
jgi:hypothetical protein